MFTDTIRVIMQAASNRNDIPIVPAIKKALAVDHLPSHTGLCMMGEVMLFFNDPDALQDIYVNKNSAFTKHELERRFGVPLLYNNILSIDTDDPQYNKKRKALSSAFFKNKVQKMVNMVKETTL